MWEAAPASVLWTDPPESGEWRGWDTTRANAFGIGMDFIFSNYGGLFKNRWD
jgi:hypothetical protein